MNIIVINIITVFIIIVMAKSLTFPAAIHSAVIFANTAGEIVNHDVTDHII